MAEEEFESFARNRDEEEQEWLIDYWGDEGMPDDLLDVLGGDDNFFREHKPPFELRTINFDWKLLPRDKHIDDYLEFYATMLQEMPQMFHSFLPDMSKVVTLGTLLDHPTLVFKVLRRFQVRNCSWCYRGCLGNVVQAVWNDKAVRTKDPERLWDRLCDEFVGIPIRDVKLLVGMQESYQLHKRPAAESMPVAAPTLTNWPHKRLQLDTTFLPNNKDPQHPNVNAIITCVDCFSKKAWAWPIHVEVHSASAGKAWDVAGATITEEARKAGDGDGGLYFANNFKGLVPWSKLQILTDMGSEFKGAFEENLRKLPNIIRIQAAPYLSRRQGAIEAFNKTLKQFIFVEFSEQGKRGKGSWVDEVPLFLQSYNNSVHSATGFTPNELHEERDPDMLAKRIPQAQERLRDRASKWVAKTKASIPKSIQDLKVGDLVRRKLRMDIAVSDAKHSQSLKGMVGVGHFIHSFYPQWSPEVYLIVNIHPSHKDWTVAKADISKTRVVSPGDATHPVTFEEDVSEDGSAEVTTEFVTHLQKIDAVWRHKVLTKKELDAQIAARREPARQRLIASGVSAPSAGRVLQEHRRTPYLLRNRK